VKSLSTGGERLPEQERGKSAVADAKLDWPPGGISHFLKTRGATQLFDMTLQESIWMSKDKNFVRVAGFGPKIPLGETQIREGVNCQKEKPAGPQDSEDFADHLRRIVHMIQHIDGHR
jgi:hypothetical protein